MSIKDELVAYKKGGNPLKERFLSFIKDTSIPLNERWETFVEAPIEFLEHYNYVHQFKAEKLIPGGEISWYDDFYIEHHETVEMAYFINSRLPEKVEEEEWPVKMIDVMKEEVLQAALGSFDFDW